MSKSFKYTDARGSVVVYIYVPIISLSPSLIEMFYSKSLFNVWAHYTVQCSSCCVFPLSLSHLTEQLRSQDAEIWSSRRRGENQRMSSPMLPPHVSWNMGTVRPRSSDQKHRQSQWPPATRMFYPELSPAMRWHLDHNQKMYNMQMFSHQFSDKFSDQYGKRKANWAPTMSKLIVVFSSIEYRVGYTTSYVWLGFYILVFKRVITV